MAIAKLDEENDDFFDQTIEDVESGKFSVKDIIGFDLAIPTVLIPTHICPQLYTRTGEVIDSFALSSIFSLVPMYNTLVFPIVPMFDNKRIPESSFKEFVGISLEDFLIFVQKGRIVPYFPSHYKEYDPELVKHFLEPGLPRISRRHMELIKKHNACKITNGNCEKCNDFYKSAKKDLEVSGEAKKMDLASCTSCLALAYSIGVNREAFLKTKSFKSTLCSMGDVITARNLGAAFETNCPTARDALNLFTDSLATKNRVETVIDGLKVKFTNDIDLKAYLDLMDGKTTQAVREAVKRIMEDPFAAKYSERLNSGIVEFNREVEEVGKSRTAKFYHAVSDIAVYGGSKYVERQTQSNVKVNQKDLHKVSEWIASKLMDIHARATGKDWTIAQLYRTRCKIEQCRKNEQMRRQGS